MGNPMQPEVGDRVIDASGLNLKDLNAKQVSQAAKVRPGFELALQAFQKASPEVLKRAKIDPSLLAEIVATYEHRKLVTAFVAPLEKLLELVKETIIANANDIAVFITDSTNTARTQAEREADGKVEKPVGAEDLEAVLEAAFAYQFGPAEQGAATRAKNKEDETKRDGA